MKKPEKHERSLVEADINGFNNLGEVIDFFQGDQKETLTLEQIRSIKIACDFYNESGDFEFRKIVSENPNYEQELKDYNRYIEIENAKKIVSKNTDSFISSLEQMAKTARQDVETAKKKLIELGVEV